MFNAQYLIDLALKNGLATVLVTWAAWRLIPAHADFLKSQTEQMRAQTEQMKAQTAMISEMRDTANKAFNAQADSDMAIKELVGFVSSGLDLNGSKLDQIHNKVDGIKAAVEKKP
ncbi:MAG: hypothetical protein FJY55_15015 [Betaproteobacteria bacterium]|nr:hypothetical protein [Betaproteobacteria bacterium]